VQRFGAVQGVGAKQTNKQGIRCGFPVKKSFSVGIRYQAVRAGCGHFSVCGAVRVRCQANKLSKQA